MGKREEGPKNPTPSISRAPRPITPLGGGRTFVRSIETAATIRPNWDEWNDRVAAQLWELVALSMDTEPEKLRGMDMRRISGGTFDHCDPEFLRRLRIAIDQCEHRQLKCLTYVSNVPFRKVGLPTFARWALGLKKEWYMPLQMKKWAADRSTEESSRNAPSKSAEKSLTTKERSSLLQIIVGLAKLAKISLINPSKSAVLIENAIIESGLPLKARTIENYLNAAVREAEEKKE